MLTRGSGSLAGAGEADFFPAQAAVVEHYQYLSTLVLVVRLDGNYTPAPYVFVSFSFATALSSVINLWVVSISLCTSAIVNTLIISIQYLNLPHPHIRLVARICARSEVYRTKILLRSTRSALAARRWWFDPLGAGGGDNTAVEKGQCDDECPGSRV